ncbi:MAG TPA: hypothetical protein VGZ23_00125 [bacterium]|nr:hypothetical protein [bacterium]
MAASRTRLRLVVTAAVLLACVAGTQAMVDVYRPIVNDEAGVPFTAAALVVRSFAGQIRGLLADFLWLRVDEYQHRRRIVNGDILRADDEALMPLVRLITWLNPHFIDAYALGGQWLAFHFGRAHEAVAFYEEGIRNNPRDASLLTGVAWVYWRFLHDPADGAARAERAARVTDNDTARFQALWIAAHILADGGDRAGAIRIWKKVSEIPGYDVTARYFLDRLSQPAPAAVPSERVSAPSDGAGSRRP